MELGTGTTDANIDEWLEVCSCSLNWGELVFGNETHDELTRLHSLPCRALRLRRKANPRRSRPDSRLQTS